MKVVKMISDFLFKQKTKDIELLIAMDEKKHPILYVQDKVTGKKTYLRKFAGNYIFRRFLIEAVLLRLMADKASAKKAVNCYYNLAKFLKDDKDEKDFN